MTTEQENLLALIPNMTQAEINTFNLNEDDFGTVIAVNSYGDGSGLNTNQIRATFDAVTSRDEFLEVIAELNEAPFACSCADGGRKPAGSPGGRP